MLDNGWVTPIDHLGEDQVGRVGSQLVAKRGPESKIGHPGDPEVADLIGGPSRTRTLDPLIKRRSSPASPQIPIRQKSATCAA